MLLNLLYDISKHVGILDWKDLKYISLYEPTIYHHVVSASLFYQASLVLSL